MENANHRIDYRIKGVAMSIHCFSIDSSFEICPISSFPILTAHGDCWSIQNFHTERRFFLGITLLEMITFHLNKQKFVFFKNISKSTIFSTFQHVMPCWIQPKILAIIILIHFQNLDDRITKNSKKITSNRTFRDECSLRNEYHYSKRIFHSFST